MDIEWNANPLDPNAVPASSVKTRIYENETFIDTVSVNGQSGIGNIGILYPNPASASCYYEADLLDSQTGMLMMYDLTGKLLSSYKLNAGYNKLDIDLSSLPNGVYLYRIMINGEQADYKKLVITK